MAQTHDNKIPFYETLPFVKSDMLHDGRQKIKTDDGCSLAPSCLNCPFPVCRWDPEFNIMWASSKEAVKALEKTERYAGILEMRRDRIQVPVIAKHFKVATRTVYRVIEKAGVLN